MQDNIITWNVTNWITITLMALVSFLILGVVASYVRAKIGGSKVNHPGQYQPQSGN